jgi:hypothetical protein
MRDPQKPATSKFQSMQSSRKVFDVAMPGTLPPSPTARPLIPPQQPPVADAQFIPHRSARLAANPAERHELLDSAGKYDRPSLLPPLPEPTVSPKDHLLPAGDEAPPRKKTHRVISSAILNREVSLSNEQKTADSESVSESADDAQTTAELSGPENAPSDYLLEETGDPYAELLASIDQDTSPDIDSADDVEFLRQDNQESDATAPADDADATQQALHTPFADQARADAGSNDDVIANTSAPLFDPQQMIISHHRQGSHVGRTILIVLGILLVLALIGNLMLDAEVIHTEINIPHSNFIAK